MLALLAELVWTLIRVSGAKASPLDRWDFMPEGTIRPPKPKADPVKTEATIKASTRRGK